MDTPTVILPTPAPTTQIHLLLAFDMDQTIPEDHIHKTLAASGETDPDKQWDLVKNFKPTGTKGEWERAFEALFKQGHYIAIVTFSSYTEIIKRYLIEVIKIDPTFFDQKKFIILTGIDFNKNSHLEAAIKLFGLPADFDKKLVILVDDDIRNTSAAEREGYRAIFATNDGAHIGELMRLVKRLCEPQNNLLMLLAESADEFHGAVRRSSPSPELQRKFPAKSRSPEPDRKKVNLIRKSPGSNK